MTERIFTVGESELILLDVFFGNMENSICNSSEKSMSNRAFLNVSTVADPIRYGNNIIPFAWWFLFDKLELQAAAEAHSAESPFVIKTTIRDALNRLTEVERMCLDCENLAAAWTNNFSKLVSNLRTEKDGALSIDLSEIKMIFEDEADFLACIEDAIEFLSSFKGIPPEMTESYLALVDLAGLVSLTDQEADQKDMEHCLIGAAWN